MDRSEPAFPVLKPHWSSASPARQFYGLTIRDYFAAAALQGMLSNGFMPAICSQHGRVPFDYHGAAYELADLMLKARGE